MLVCERLTRVFVPHRRSLTPLGKQYLMRLIHVDHPVTLAALERWCNLPALSLHQAALVRLLELGLLTLTVPPAEPSAVDAPDSDPAIHFFGSNDRPAAGSAPLDGRDVERTERQLSSSSPFHVLLRAADPRSTVMCNPNFARSLRAALANQSVPSAWLQWFCLEGCAGGRPRTRTTVRAHFFLSPHLSEQSPATPQQPAGPGSIRPHSSAAAGGVLEPLAVRMLRRPAGIPRGVRMAA